MWRILGGAPAGAALSPLRAALGLLLGPAVALGLGRFAYALVLPDMRAELSWSFATAGTMNTANALGYLFGALLAAPLARAFGERRMFIGSLLATALLLAFSAVTGAAVVVFGLRLLTGITGAVCFVVGGGLVAQVGRDGGAARATLLLSLYFAGGGIGVVLSGLVVPAAVQSGGWRLAWAVMGVLALLATAVATPIAARVPETVAPSAEVAARPAPLRPLAGLMACYGLFGAGYIAYMTFVVALLESAGAGSADVSVFWVLLGVAATVAGVLWGRVLARVRPGYGTAAVLTVLTVGALLPVVSTGRVGFVLSAVLFGSSFLMVVTAITSSARRALPPHRWTGAIAALTVAFALGQCAGPLLAGMLSDGSGGVEAGLAIGAGLLAFAALLALAQGVRHYPA